MTVLKVASGGLPEANTNWWCCSGRALRKASSLLNVLPSASAVNKALRAYLKGKSVSRTA